MSDYKFPGMMKKVINKKDIEELRKREDEVAAAKAFEEYITDFQDAHTGTKALSKTWVKAGVYEAGKKYEESKDKSNLYKPTSRYEKEVLASQQHIEKIDDTRPDRLGKKREKEKRKSNLEIFKDELKLIQEEREERHRLKTVLGLQEVIKLPPKPGDALRASLSLELEDVKMGSIDDGDPNTTNIYLGNLPTKVTEQGLMELFGKFGPLASVKVMWPRTEEEKARNRLSGFVAFMARRDGERALKQLSGKDILGTEVKLGWGKAVPIPTFPIYVPPQMLEMTMPPPMSGIPFNAQPHKNVKHKVPPLGTPYPTDPKGIQDFQRVLENSTVKVVPPTERGLLALIHRMVEFVAREGPMFEAMVMNREMTNPAYRFLFENQGPAHTYYRWKLFSVIQGESVQHWRTEDFRMFKNGSIWKPPTLHPFTQGMPEELIPEEERDIRKGTLSNAQRDRLERMLRRISPEKHRIAEVMIFCIEHSESVDEICQTLKESLNNPKTALQKKVARLFTVSDILRNAGAKGMNAVVYRKCLKNILPSIFQELHYSHQTAIAAGSGTSAESFKERVMGCFRAWEEWELFPKDFLIRLQNIFLGLITLNSREDEAQVLAGVEDKNVELKPKRRRSPPRAAMPPKSALNLVRVMQSIEPGVSDLDGTPLDDDLDGVPLIEKEITPPLPTSEPTTSKGTFIPSKWETVDPEEVKAQAVTTTSKWDLFEEPAPPSQPDITQDEDLDGVPMDDDEDESPSDDGKAGADISEDEMTEERRVKLREIENRVIEFQDDIEAGRKKVNPGDSISRLVQQYRDKLMKKANRDRDRYYERDDEEQADRGRQRKSEYSSVSKDRRSPEQRSQSHYKSERDRDQYCEREPRSDREYRNERELRSDRESYLYERESLKYDRADYDKTERDPRSDRELYRAYEDETRHQRRRRRSSDSNDEDDDRSRSSSEQYSRKYSSSHRNGSPSPKRAHHSLSSRDGSPRRRSRSPRRSSRSPSRRHRRH